MQPERWGRNTNGRQGLLLSTCGLFKLAHGSAEWRGSVSRNAISLHKSESARRFREVTWVPLHRVGQEARTVRLSLPFPAP
ncbi:hypothetical protein Taro_037620 [Colocasia esculenta]|uniref:Uncharacterized protein n=1 Tax=Colocasia esculenta TaxID=4460 RepID=A0A843W4L5_COLES|nr:hypothetical protein [Colocasia esculenta]